MISEDGEGRGKGQGKRGSGGAKAGKEGLCWRSYLRFGLLCSGFRLLRGREGDSQSQCLVVVLRLLQPRMSLEGLANVAPGNRGAALHVDRTERHGLQKKVLLRDVRGRKTDERINPKGVVPGPVLLGEGEMSAGGQSKKGGEQTRVTRTRREKT
jgi:hypothetical protein